MTIIRQPSLFGIQELYDMEPTQKYEAIISAIDLDLIYHAINKKSRLGAPVELNYAGMIISFFIRYIERIPTIKDLIKRLNDDFIFKMNCGFLVSDAIPSEAAYSRLVTKLSESDILEKSFESVTLAAVTEGFIADEVIAIDATHFEARDKAPVQKEEKPEAAPKKRGRKSKEEREQYLQEQAEKEANQYILQSLFSSGSLNDGKAAIALLKGTDQRLPLTTVHYNTLDAGYDFEPIYEQIHRMGQQSVIAYNKRNEGEMIGFDKNFAPTCFREHSYKYDSFDPKYETLKYTRPKECSDCPLANEGICQKVYKVKITTDLRRYTAPARGSRAWKKIFKQRTAVERVNAYLKEFYQLNNVRYRTGKRAKVHFDMVALIYNASKLAADRIQAELIQQQQTA
ncbi:transposase [Oceanobacillus timonensis]|uniref:transposase n=1 Tax=Oceanobacillus timonensis TaxID=1926285 RepID=UPI0009B98835|nr:transposase [Oceanobacillus timonensis]